MTLFLPIAGMGVNLFLLVSIGTVVGFLSGLLGVGGGFLLTPALIMTGMAPAVAAASDSCQIVAASASGVAAHFRLGNVDRKMGAVLLLGGFAGGGLGVEIIKLLRRLGEAGVVIDICYVVMLTSVGGFMMVNSIRVLRGRAGPRRPAKGRKRASHAALPLQMDFPSSGVRHSIFVPLFVAFLVGVLAAVMGVGGGFIMLPLMVYLLHMPTHMAVGTSLFQILFVSSFVTYEQATVNHTVDIVLALLLALGSTVGAQIGARVNRHLRGEQLLIVLATLALLVAGEMTFSLVRTPKNLLEPSRVQSVAQRSEENGAARLTRWTLHSAGTSLAVLDTRYHRPAPAR